MYNPPTATSKSALFSLFSITKFRTNRNQQTSLMIYPLLTNLLDPRSQNMVPIEKAFRIVKVNFHAVNIGFRQ